jgi:ribosome maturation factor RimP
MNDELQSVVQQEVEASGYELVELRRRGTRARPVIELRIDRRDGQNVTVNDCAKVSRVVEARLDSGSLVAERYELQVSSPGDRPLRSTQEWKRFVGRWASVLSPANGGRFEGKIVAIEEHADGDVVVLESDRGVARRVPLADVEEARLSFHW